MGVQMQASKVCLLVERNNHQMKSMALKDKSIDEVMSKPMFKNDMNYLL